MKIIALSVLIFFSLINITNAIPIPALVIGYEFIIFAIPSTLVFFSILFFYFRKYLFYTNIYLLILSVVLYIIHYYITGEIFIYNIEYLMFILVLILIIIVNNSKFNRIKFINYLLLILLIGINFLFVKIDYNLLQYNSFCDKSKKTESNIFIFNKCNIYDNKLIINFIEKETSYNTDIWIFVSDKDHIQGILQSKGYSFEYRYPLGDCGKKCILLIDGIIN